MTPHCYTVCAVLFIYSAYIVKKEVVGLQRAIRVRVLDAAGAEIEKSSSSVSYIR